MRTIIIVATYIMLQAAELGAPATWCNFFVDTGLEKSPGLFPDGRSVSHHVHRNPCGRGESFSHAIEKETAGSSCLPEVSDFR
ncbi:MAG: hypothetical protein J5806_08670 [Lentisphaeria bacterium]|nr:hypothetical protein [Lentisphaeria bacterium]